MVPDGVSVVLPPSLQLRPSDLKTGLEVLIRSPDNQDGSCRKLGSLERSRSYCVNLARFSAWVGTVRSVYVCRPYRVCFPCAESAIESGECLSRIHEWDVAVVLTIPPGCSIGKPRGVILDYD